MCKAVKNNCISSALAVHSTFSITLSTTDVSAWESLIPVAGWFRGHRPSWMRKKVSTFPSFDFLIYMEVSCLMPTHQFFFFPISHLFYIVTSAAVCFWPILIKQLKHWPFWIVDVFMYKNAYMALSLINTLHQWSVNFCPKTIIICQIWQPFCIFSRSDLFLFFIMCFPFTLQNHQGKLSTSNL